MKWSTKALRERHSAESKSNALPLRLATGCSFWNPYGSRICEALSVSCPCSIPKPYYKPGTQRLKSAVKVLGSRRIDQRTTVGRALHVYRQELIADLGGEANLSRQE